MNVETLDPIDVSDRVDIGFPFAAQIDAGETISGFTVDVKVRSGSDPSPQTVRVGQPVVPTGTFEVLQRVQGHAGIGTVTYRFKGSVTLSSGRILTRFYDITFTDYFS